MINKLKTNRAFTFIEVAVVVAVIGIITAITVPSMLDSKDKALAARVQALDKLLSDACVRSGLDGNSVPAPNQDTLQDVVGWYQANGYLAASPAIDTTGMDLKMINVDYANCASASLAGVGTTGTGGAPVSGTTTTAELPSAPGPVTEAWYDTRRLTIDLPSLSTGAQSLTLQESSDGQNWTPVASGEAGGATYSAGPFNPSTTGYYRVDAINAYGETAGPAITAITAPPLSLPGSLSITGSTASQLPGVTLPPGVPGSEDSGSGSTGSGGVSGGGGGWSLSGIPTGSFGGGGTGGWDNGGGPGLYNSGTSSGLSAPGKIGITNLSSTGYTLDLPTLPHDIVTENGTVYDFAFCWILYSSTDGTNWNYNADWQWASQSVTSGSTSQFGWADSQGNVIANPAPLAITVAPGTTESYKLVGVDTEGLTVSGQVISVTSPTGQVSDANVPAAPYAPTTSNIGATSLSVTLPALPAYAASLTLESSTDGITWTDAGSGLAGNAVVQQTGLTSNSIYYYSVVAVNQYGTAQGDMVSATTFGPPGVPADMTFSNITPTSYTITLPALPAGATSFLLQDSYDGGNTWYPDWNDWDANGNEVGLGGNAVIQVPWSWANTTFYYNLVATNQYGSTTGPTDTVTTLSYPANDVLSIQDANYEANGWNNEAQTPLTDVLDFQINLAWQSSTDHTFTATTADGSAIAGKDYVATSGTVTIPAGQTQTDYFVQTTANDYRVTDATMTVTIASTDSNVTLSRATASGVVPAMQPAPGSPTLNIHPGYYGATGTNGSGTMTFSLTLSASNAFDTICTVATQDGSAIAGTDYIAESGTLTIPTGQTSTTFTVPVLANPQRSQVVTFSAAITDPNAFVNTTKAAGIIPSLTGATGGPVAVTTLPVYNVFSEIWTSTYSYLQETNGIQPVGADTTLSFKDISNGVYDPLPPIDELVAAYDPSFMAQLGGSPTNASQASFNYNQSSQNVQSTSLTVCFVMPLNYYPFDWNWEFNSNGFSAEGSTPVDPAQDAITVDTTPDTFSGFSVYELVWNPNQTALTYDFTSLAGEVTSMTIDCEVLVSSDGPITSFMPGDASSQTDVWTTVDVSYLIGTAGTWNVPVANGTPAMPSLPAILESNLVQVGMYHDELFSGSAGLGTDVQYDASISANLGNVTLTWAPGVTPFVPNQNPQ
jgi:prepilin-type N-terminal cleavage/methylation domain-containing protein